MPERSSSFVRGSITRGLDSRNLDCQTASQDRSAGFAERGLVLHPPLGQVGLGWAPHYCDGGHQVNRSFSSLSTIQARTACTMIRGAIRWASPSKSSDPSPHIATNSSLVLWLLSSGSKAITRSAHKQASCSPVSASAVRLTADFSSPSRQSTQRARFSIMMRKRPSREASCAPILINLSHILLRSSAMAFGCRSRQPL